MFASKMAVYLELRRRMKSSVSCNGKFVVIVDSSTCALQVRPVISEIDASWRTVLDTARTVGSGEEREDLDTILERASTW